MATRASLQHAFLTDAWTSSFVPLTSSAGAQEWKLETFWLFNEWLRLVRHVGLCCHLLCHFFILVHASARLRSAHSVDLAYMCVMLAMEISGYIKRDVHRGSSAAGQGVTRRHS
jgi:hypothetical protein